MWCGAQELVLCKKHTRKYVLHVVMAFVHHSIYYYYNSLDKGKSCPKIFNFAQSVIFHLKTLSNRLVIKTSRFSKLFWFFRCKATGRWSVRGDAEIERHPAQARFGQSDGSGRSMVVSRFLFYFISMVQNVGRLAGTSSKTQKKRQKTNMSKLFSYVLNFW